MRKLLLSASLIVLAGSPSFAENLITERKVSAFLRSTSSFSTEKVRQEIAKSSLEILLGKYLEKGNGHNNSDGVFRLLNELLQAYEKDKNLNPQGEQANNSDLLKMPSGESIFLDSFVNFIENIKNKSEKHDLKNDLKNRSLKNEKNSFHFKMQEISEKQTDIRNSFDNLLQPNNNLEENHSSTGRQTFALGQQNDNEKNTPPSVAESILAFEKLKIESNSENYSDYAVYMSNFLGLFLDILSNFNPKTAHEFFETFSILKSLYSDYLSSPHADPEIADSFGEAIEKLDTAANEIRSAEENGTEINIEELAQKTVAVVSRTIQKTVTHIVTQISVNSPHIEVDDQTTSDINIAFNEKESPKTSIEKILLDEVKSYRDLENLVKHYVNNKKTQEELLTILRKAEHQGNSLGKTQSNDQKPVIKDPNIENLEKAYKEAGITEDVPLRTASMLSGALKNNKEISSLLSELKTSIVKSAGAEEGQEQFYKMMEQLQKEYAEKGDNLTVQKIEKYINDTKIEDNLVDFSKISFTEKKKNIPVINEGSPPPPPPPPGDINFGSADTSFLPPPPPPGLFTGGLPSLSMDTKIIDDLPGFYSENISFNPETRAIEMTDGAVKKLLQSEFQRFINERKATLKNALLTKNLSHSQLKIEQQKIDKLNINLNKAILNRQFTKGTDNLSINDIKSYTQLIEILGLASGNLVLGERPLFETTEDYQKFIEGIVLPIFNNINPITVQDKIEDRVHDQVSRIIQNGTVEGTWDAYLIQRIEQKIKISGKKDTIGKLLLQTRKTTSQSREEFDSFILGKDLNSLEDFVNYVANNVKGVTDKKEIGNQFQILEEAKKENSKKTSSQKEKVKETENLIQDPLDTILNQSLIECGIDQENVDNCIKQQSRALFLRAIHKGEKWDDIVGFLPEIEKAFMSIPEPVQDIEAPQTQVVKKERVALYKFLDKMASNISEKNDLFDGAKLELQRQETLLEIYSLKFYTPQLTTLSTEIDTSFGPPPPPPPMMEGLNLEVVDTSFGPPPPPPTGGIMKSHVFEEKSLNDVMRNVSFENEKINIEKNLLTDLFGNWLRLKVEKNGSDFDVFKFIKLKSSNIQKIQSFEDFTNFLREIIDDRTLTKCKVPVFDNSGEIIDDAITIAKGFIIGKIHESRFEVNPEKAIEEYFRNDLGRIGDQVSKNREDHVAFVLSNNLGAKSATTRGILKEFSQKFIKATLKQKEKEDEVLRRNSSINTEIDPLDN